MDCTIAPFSLARNMKGVCGGWAVGLKFCLGFHNDELWQLSWRRRRKKKLATGFLTYLFLNFATNVVISELLINPKPFIDKSSAYFKSFVAAIFLLFLFLFSKCIEKTRAALIFSFYPLYIVYMFTLLFLDIGHCAWT